MHHTLIMTDTREILLNKGNRMKYMTVVIRRMKRMEMDFKMDFQHMPASYGLFEFTV